MIRLLFPVLTTVLILICGCGGSAPPAVTEGDVEELIAARASLKQAMIDRDVETLRRIYTKDYGLVTRKGALRTLSERIGMIESGTLNYVRVGVESEVSIRTVGQVAVVRGVVGSSETEFEGVRREPGLRRFTEIWVHEDGRWREVGRQATSIAPSGESEDFVGTWTLESIEGQDESGGWVALQDRFGRDPAGYLMYASGGHMSVQIMRRNRRPFATESRRDVLPEEAKEALLGYTAYFGTFSVDAEEGTVTHHRVGHIVPNQVAVDGTRFYRFNGDMLTLTLPGRSIRLIWKRLS